MYNTDDVLTQAGPMTIQRRAADGLPDATSVGQVTSTIGYNSYGEVVDLEYLVGSTSLFHEHVVRDALGRIEQVDETWSGSATTTRQYRYDAASRLWKVLDVSGAQLFRYEYDEGGLGNGNRTAVYGASDQLLMSAAYDAQDRMTSYGGASYSYTAAGELARRATATDTLSTEYDALGNLVSAGHKLASTSGPNAPITVGTIYTYQVDGRNRRVRKLVNDEPVRGWLYRDRILVAAELDGAGALRHRYVYGTLAHSPDLLIRGDTAYRMVTDHLGSVRAVVRAGDGLVVERRDYDAWGVPTLATVPEFQGLGYAGGLTDSDTKFVRFGARDYVCDLGRWSARDPAGVQNEQTNQYSYLDCSPLTDVDPTGMWPHHGHWGGPGWRNGMPGSELGNYPHLPSHPGFDRPVDARDECYREHDVNLRACARISDPRKRMECRREADWDLASCLMTLGDRGCARDAWATWFEQGIFGGLAGGWTPNGSKPGEYRP